LKIHSDQFCSIPGRSNNGFFSLHHHIQTSSGAYPASYPVSTGGSYPRVKVARVLIDHPPPYSAKVKNVWSCISTPPIRLHGMVFN